MLLLNAANVPRPFESSCMRCRPTLNLLWGAIGEEQHSAALLSKSPAFSVSLSSFETQCVAVLSRIQVLQNSDTFALRAGSVERKLLKEARGSLSSRALSVSVSLVHSLGNKLRVFAQHKSRLYYGLNTYILFADNAGRQRGRRWPRAAQAASLSSLSPLSLSRMIESSTSTAFLGKARTWTFRSDKLFETICTVCRKR